MPRMMIANSVKPAKAGSKVKTWLLSHNERENMIKTVEQKLAELNAPKDNSELERHKLLLSLMPKDIEYPTVSNIRTKDKPLEPMAWVSFSGPAYDPGKTFKPVEILKRLEGIGWRTDPATLCAWADYRHYATPGTQDTIPETRKGCFGATDKLRDSVPICPLWVDISCFTGAEAKCFYDVPAFGIVRLCIKLPPVASVHASRIEHLGGWRYRPGSGCIVFPESWHSIEGLEGEPIAQIERAKAYIPTDQSVDGEIYWQPIAHEQETFPLSAADFLEKLLR